MFPEQRAGRMVARAGAPVVKIVAAFTKYQRNLSKAADRSPEHRRAVTTRAGDRQDHDAHGAGVRQRARTRIGAAPVAWPL